MWPVSDFGVESGRRIPLVTYAQYMYSAPMNIEFDAAKNAVNIRDHGIDLADVEGVFYDEYALTM